LSFFVALLVILVLVTASTYVLYPKTSVTTEDHTDPQLNQTEADKAAIYNKLNCSIGSIVN
jgi:zona occludens toxin (predicted ATPase)